MVKLFVGSCENLKENETFERLLCTVGPERRQKVLRRKMMGDKVLSLGAGLLLIEAVVSCGINPQEAAACALVTGKNGKPYFADERLKSFYFSLSHSGTYCICTLSDCETGCDIQKIGVVKPAVAKRFMSDDEYERWSKISSPKEQAYEYYRLWTVKEAYLKYTGEGLSGDMRSVQTDKCSAKFWTSTDIEGYFTAVCMPEKNEVTIQNIIFK